MQMERMDKKELISIVEQLYKQTNEGLDTYLDKELLIQQLMIIDMTLEESTKCVYCNHVGIYSKRDYINDGHPNRHWSGFYIYCPECTKESYRGVNR